MRDTTRAAIAAAIDQQRERLREHEVIIADARQQISIAETRRAAIMARIAELEEDLANG